jgi:hypothetical protein
VIVHARKKGGLGSPGAADFDGAVPTTLLNADEENGIAMSPVGREGQGAHAE